MNTASYEQHDEALINAHRVLMDAAHAIRMREGHWGPCSPEFRTLVELSATLGIALEDARSARQASIIL